MTKTQTAPQTAVVRVTDPVPGDKIQISDARGQVRRFELQHEEHYRTDETCVACQIAQVNGRVSKEITANNLYRRMRPFLRIMGTVAPDGTLTLVQEEAGAVKDIEVVGDTFVVVKQWS